MLGIVSWEYLTLNLSTSFSAWHPESPIWPFIHSLLWALVSLVDSQAWPVCTCSLLPHADRWPYSFSLHMEPGRWGFVNNEWGYVVKLHYGTWEAGKHSTLDLYQCRLIYLVLIAEQGRSVSVFHNLFNHFLTEGHEYCVQSGTSVTALGHTSFVHMWRIC